MLLLSEFITQVLSLLSLTVSSHVYQQAIEIGQQHFRYHTVFHLFCSLHCSILLQRSMWPSGQGIGFKIKRFGVRFPLLVMFRSVGQISHSILPLPTQQLWVLGGTKNCKIVKGISCRKCAEFSQEEMRLYKRVPIPGVQITKSAELTGISTYKHTVHIYVLRLQSSLVQSILFYSTLRALCNLPPVFQNIFNLYKVK